MHRWFATVALVVLAMRAAGATTYYAATTGNDHNTGTLVQPFRTLAHGVSVLKPGDTLLVRAGNYTEALTANVPSGTSWAVPVTVAAYPGETVILRPNVGPASVLMFYGHQQFIVVSGFILDASNIAHDAVKITVTGTNSYASHICLQSCEIKNAHEQGILVTDGANYNQFLNLKVHDNALDGKSHPMPLDHYHGMYIATDHNFIKGCSVYHNAGYGIQCYDDSGTAVHDNVVCGNTCYNNGVAGLSGAGIILSSGSNNVAFNNVIYGNQYGISVDYSAINTGVYNNTVYGNREYGIYIGSGSTNAVVENNIGYKNGWPPDLINDGSLLLVASHNLIGIDPIFRNPAVYDFHLTSASVLAIDTGLTIPMVTTDFDGILRPQGFGYDIGAFEYH